MLGAAVVETDLGRNVDRRSRLHFHGGVDAVQLDHVGLGEILLGRLGGQHVSPVVAGETRQPRLFHGDLGAGDHQAAELDRDLGEHPQRLERTKRASPPSTATAVAPGRRSAGNAPAGCGARPHGTPAPRRRGQPPQTHATQRDRNRIWRPTGSSPPPPPARESGGPRAILAISPGDSRPKIWPGRGSGRLV